MNIHASADRIIFDFQTALDTTGWQVVNDEVMGGMSRGSFHLSNGVAVFRGEVSLANNGGFASVRALPTRSDLAGCDAFVIRVRGDGHRYRFTSRTDQNFDSPIHQASFTTRKDEWDEHRFSWRDFTATFHGRMLSSESPLDLVRVMSVGFLIADKQEGPFRLEIAWIKAMTLPEQ